jgi:hypothetical protein
MKHKYVLLAVVCVVVAVIVYVYYQSKGSTSQRDIDPNKLPNKGSFCVTDASYLYKCNPANSQCVSGICKALDNACSKKEGVCDSSLDCCDNLVCRSGKCKSFCDDGYCNEDVPCAGPLITDGNYRKMCAMPVKAGETVPLYKNNCIPVGQKWFCNDTNKVVQKTATSDSLSSNAEILFLSTQNGDCTPSYGARGIADKNSDVMLSGKCSECCDYPAAVARLVLDKENPTSPASFRCLNRFGVVDKDWKDRFVIVGGSDQPWLSCPSIDKLRKN